VIGEMLRLHLLELVQEVLGLAGRQVRALQPRDQVVLPGQVSPALRYVLRSGGEVL
jgi:hypothetical protein